MESGWNIIWVWLVGVVSRKRVRLVGVGGVYGSGMSIWRYGAKMSTTRIFLAPVRKKPAPEIRLGSGRPASSVGKARPPYFTAHVYTHVYYKKKTVTALG